MLLAKRTGGCTHCSPVKQLACRLAIRQQTRVTWAPKGVCRAQQRVDITKPQQNSRSQLLSGSAQEIKQAPPQASAFNVKEHDVVSGTVTDIQPFGVFVDLNGVQALLPKGQISHARVEDITTVFKRGDSLKALVLEHSRSGRITLGTRQLEANKGDMLRDSRRVLDLADEMGTLWRLNERFLSKDYASGGRQSPGQEAHPSGIQEGDVVQGTVRRVTRMGLFIDLESGGVGVLPASQISHTGAPDYDSVFKAGDVVKALVLDVDLEPGLVALGTRQLEVHRGDMLTDMQRVFDSAEEMGAMWRWRREQRRVAAKAQQGGTSGGQVKRGDSHTVNKLKDGQVVQGTVASVETFGVVIDLEAGGVAVLPVSQVSHERVEDVGSLFETGDVIQVLLLRCESNFIQVSTKVLEPTPGDMVRHPQLVFDRAEEMGARWRQQRDLRWAAEDAQAQWARRDRFETADVQVGQLVRGTVQSVSEIGVFIDLDVGVTALLHKSEISHRRVEDVRTIFKAGEMVKVLVLDCDPARERVAVSTKYLEPSPGAMLRHKQEVFLHAEEAAAEWRRQTGQIPVAAASHDEFVTSNTLHQTSAASVAPVLVANTRISKKRLQQVITEHLKSSAATGPQSAPRSTLLAYALKRNLISEERGDAVPDSEWVQDPDPAPERGTTSTRHLETAPVARKLEPTERAMLYGEPDEFEEPEETEADSQRRTAGKAWTRLVLKSAASAKPVLTGNTWVPKKVLRQVINEHHNNTTVKAPGGIPRSTLLEHAHKLNLISEECRNAVPEAMKERPLKRGAGNHSSTDRGQDRPPYSSTEREEARPPYFSTGRGQARPSYSSTGTELPIRPEASPRSSRQAAAAPHKAVASAGRQLLFPAMEPGSSLVDMGHRTGTASVQVGDVVQTCGHRQEEGPNPEVTTNSVVASNHWAGIG